MMQYQQLAYLSVSHAGGFVAGFRQGGVMFWLRAQEIAYLKSQLVISGWGGVHRAAPYGL
jgi:hypothetical protein